MVVSRPVGYEAVASKQTNLLKPGAVIISDTVQEVFVIIGNAIWPVK